MTRICIFSVCLASALVIMASGCATKDRPFGDRTAVLILHHTPKEILDASATVFASRNFEIKSVGKKDAVFERKAGSLQSLAWGGWHAGSSWERATLHVSDYGGDAFLLVAEVNVVSDKGDAFFEDKHSLSRRALKPYQEMLDEVQRNLP